MFFTLTTFDDKLDTQHVFNFGTISDAVDYAYEEMDWTKWQGYYVTATFYHEDLDNDINTIVFTENVDDVFLTDSLEVKPFTPRYS